jgi:hypothetical protein
MHFMSECSDSYWPVIGDGYLALNTGSIALLFLGAAAVQHSGASTEVVPSWKPQPQADANVPEFVTVGMIATAATVALIQSARYGARSADACERARIRLIQGPPVGLPPGTPFDLPVYAPTPP